MDDIVRQAMAKWPNVPNCYGWLGLDARGNWYMRDDRVQQQGTFAQAKGSLLQHEKLIDFIHRNYASDDVGCWYFQNGPQRVYVELEVAPFIWRIDESGRIKAHTGLDAELRSSWVDEAGRLYALTTLGFGLVHTLDVGIAADLIERNAWQPGEIASSDFETRFGFVKSPAANLTKP